MQTQTSISTKPAPGEGSFPITGTTWLWVLTTVFLVFLSSVVVAGEKIWSEDKRFVDNGDRTITDTQTGLMWMKQDSYQLTGEWLSWYESVKFVQQLNQAGFANYIDWEMPTVDQLRALYDPKKTNGAQAGSEMTLHFDPIFAGNGSGSLWTVENNGVYNAFGVVLNTGQRFNSAKDNKARKAVRAVRRANP